MLPVIGDNGTGKTTLLKDPQRSGSCRMPEVITLGSKVQIGYYDQEHHVLHMEKTIFDEISDDLSNILRIRKSGMCWQPFFLPVTMSYKQIQCFERWRTRTCFPCETDALRSKFPDPR